MKQRSLVLITVDCLRADHVGFLGYSRPTTGFLDSLAQESFVFPQAIVAGAPTYFSFPAIMASRYPLGLGRDVLGIAPQEPTLATCLQESGYATAAFLAANPYLSPRFGYQQGFETFRDFLTAELPSDNPDSKSGHLTRLNQFLQRASQQRTLTSAAYNELYFRYCQWRSFRHPVAMDQLRRYPAADVMVDQARSWLSSLGEEPFFLWLHLMDPHHPYYPPEQALSEFGCGKMDARRAGFLNSFWNRGDVNAERLFRYRAQVLSLYDAGIYWVDKQIARLVAALQQFHRWDETVVAVTADHGEEFLEHDARYHSPVHLPEELIHVPLLIRVPGAAGLRQPEIPFSLIHLSPTLLDILNVDRPSSFQGISYWEQIKTGQLPDEPAIVECVESCNNPFRMDDRLHPRLLAVRGSSRKLIINFHSKTEHLYDLRSDPAERAPLTTSDGKAERARLLRAARQHLQTSQHNLDTELRLRARVREFQQHAQLVRSRNTELEAAGTF